MKKKRKYTKRSKKHTNMFFAVKGSPTVYIATKVKVFATMTSPKMASMAASWWNYRKLK